MSEEHFYEDGVMQVVIDSNMMQSAELFEYLSDGANVAVLPDYVWAECYKQQSLVAVQSFLSVVRYFPDQIAVLRSGKQIAGFDPRTTRFPKAFELENVPTDLRAMETAVDQATAGAAAVLAQLREQWDAATATMDDMLQGAEEDILPSLPELASMFTADELGRCRRKEKYTPAMTEKVFGTAFGIYEHLVEIDPRVPLLPPRHAVETFYYRFALGAMLHCIWWIRNGSQSISKTERLRNDYVDLGLASCATYYDGFMTNDTKAAWLHNELANALKFAQAEAAAHSSR
ncbi:hypothetical protein ABS767_05755 [Sphingomonas sp. ST-64]|uniref:Uncharacterized protein n=1 Tax=Sphingomonas plantiphila TaxID=3163295 RepID=A0ABW8YJM9_9SPHN